MLYIDRGSKFTTPTILLCHFSISDVQLGGSTMPAHRHIGNGPTSELNAALTSLQLMKAACHRNALVLLSLHHLVNGKIL